jgi:hypothetical protein
LAPALRCYFSFFEAALLARLEKLPWATLPPVDLAVALWMRAASITVIGVRVGPMDEGFPGISSSFAEKLLGAATLTTVAWIKTKCGSGDGQ